MTALKPAYVYDAVRTPFGKIGGGLAAVRPDDLAAHVIGELVKRAPNLPNELSEAESRAMIRRMCL